MISPKLLVLLQNFSKNDRNSFLKFLHSPFHNENQDLVKLFKIVHPQLEKINGSTKENRQLDKKIVWEKIKNSAPYQDEAMRRICSDLTKKAYNYLAYKQFKKKPTRRINLSAPYYKYTSIE